MEKYANRDILIIGTHFATPTAGHLKTKADGSEGYWLDTSL
jgi:hypothetical protein